MKLDLAALIAGVTALVGGGIWLGGLQGKVDSMTQDGIKNYVDEAIVEALGKQPTLNSGNPIGTVIMFWGDETPDGYEVCDGSMIHDDRSVLVNQKKPDFSNRFPMFTVSLSNHHFGGNAEVVLSEKNLPPHTHPNPGIGVGTWKFEKKDNNRKNYLEHNDKHKANPNLNYGPSEVMTAESFKVLPPYQTVTCLIKVR